MFKRELYIERRERLKKSVEEGLLLFLGNNDVGMNYPSNSYRFRQDSTFLYLFGLDMPNLAAAIDCSTGEELLFGNDVSIDDIIWMGPQIPMKERGERVGVERVLPLDKLENYLANYIKRGVRVHYLPPYRLATTIKLSKMLSLDIAKVANSFSVELIKAVVALREIKDSYELEEIEKGVDIAYKMHMAATKAASLGMVEQELAGLMEGIAITYGYMPSFPIILSQNGETLHNNSHHQLLSEGRLLVIDAGAETNMHYASDLTRTLPSSGTFTPIQKDIYTIVSNANQKAIELIRPSIPYRDIHLAASQVLARGLVDLGIMKGNPTEAVAAGAHALFMPHGLGHQMGLDVHDMEDFGEDFVGYSDTFHRATQFGLKSLRMGKELKVGHVITVEPGCYFIPALIEKWRGENLHSEFINYSALPSLYSFGGIRLEDDVVVTAEGCRILGSQRLPITPSAVEEAMAK
ncbi:MAG: aminopeptidase P family protein [Bacteroidales bacterium]